MFKSFDIKITTMGQFLYVSTVLKLNDYLQQCKPVKHTQLEQKSAKQRPR